MNLNLPFRSIGDSAERQLEQLALFKTWMDDGQPLSDPAMTELAKFQRTLAAVASRGLERYSTKNPVTAALLAEPAHAAWVDPEGATIEMDRVYRDHVDTLELDGDPVRRLQAELLFGVAAVQLGAALIAAIVGRITPHATADAFEAGVAPSWSSPPPPPRPWPRLVDPPRQLLDPRTLAAVKASLEQSKEALEKSPHSTYETVVAEATTNGPPATLAAFHWLCSMRVVPQRPETYWVVGLAQTVHWTGFGSDGELWRDTVLEPWAALSVGKQAGSVFGYGRSAAPTMFGKFGGDARAAITSHAAETIGRHFGLITDPIRIVEDGCGPGLNFSRMVLERWRSDRAAVGGAAPLPSFALTASDVNAAALLEVGAKLSGPDGDVCTRSDGPDPGLTISRVLYRDLTRYFEVDADKYEFGLSHNQHDVYAQSYVWHQLGDSRPVEHQPQLRLVRAAVRTVRPGGLIYLADAGPSIWGPHLSAGANLFDREGHLPPTVFSAAEWDKLAVEEPDGDHWKIACELDARQDIAGGAVIVRVATVVPL